MGKIFARFLVTAALALLPVASLACEIFTSTEKAPGARLLIEDGLDLIVRENGVDRVFSTGSAGTGTGIRVAFPVDQKTDPVEIDQGKGVYWLGPEKFVEYCQ